MRWGMGWGCPWGDPDSWVIIISVSDFRTGAIVKFLALYSQYYQLVVDGKNAGAPIYVDAGATATVSGNYSLATGPHVVSVVGVGPWASPGKFDVTAVQSAFLANRSERINIQIVPTLEQFTVADGGALTNVQINGLKRFSNCRAVTNNTTWAELDVVISGTVTITPPIIPYRPYPGGIGPPPPVPYMAVTVDLCLGTQVLAQSIIRLENLTPGVPQTITFLEMNASGVASVGTNTATLTYAGAVPLASGAVLVTAWPAKYPIYISQGTPVVSFTSPTAVVNDDGSSNAFAYKSGKLSTADYYIVVHETNALGVESTGTTNEQVQIEYVPAGPGVPVYVSGNASATAIEFLASTDNASTYNIYDSTTIGAIGPVPSATAAAGTGQITATLAPLEDLFYTGARYVFVRSLLAGVESGNSSAVVINYVNGVAQVLRPNPPSVSGWTGAGRTLSVQFTLDMLNQPTLPVSIALFIGSSPTLDFTTPAATLSIAGATARFVIGSIAGTVGSDGSFYFAIRSVTAGGFQSANTDAYGPVKLSLAVPADPSFDARGGI